MLKQRVITAIVLLAILLPALFWRTPQPFIAIARSTCRTRTS